MYLADTLGVYFAGSYLTEGRTGDMIRFEFGNLKYNSSKMSELKYLFKKKVKKQM